MTELPADVSLTIANQAWPDVEDLVTTTETPGGYAECTFSLPSIQGAQIAIDDKLVIYDSVNARWPFIGRINKVHKTGLCFDFTAVRSTRLRQMEKTTTFTSPSHPSGEYAGRIYKASTPIVTALQDALSLCDDVFDGGINSLSGLQFVGDSINIAGYEPEQIWDWVSGLVSNQATTILLWHIRGAASLQVVVIDYQDLAARYRVQLPEDQIDELYDADSIITRAAVEWGNDQVFVDALLSVGLAGRQLAHGKYVNGSRDLKSLSDAQGLTGQYLGRLGRFQAANTTLTLKCNTDTVTVVPPVGSSDNWPLWLVESGHGIALLNRPVNLAPYNEPVKQIIGTTYTWKTGELTCTCGIAGGGLGSTIQSVVDYNVNRTFNGPYNGPPGGNHPLADADLIPLVGGEVTGPQPSTSYGTPAFKDALTAGDPNVPFDKQVDPNLIADEGLEANINFDPTTTGFQAAIRTTPGTYNEYRILLGADTGLVAGTVVAELYKVLPTGIQFLFNVQSSGLKDRTAVINPPVTLARGDYYMIKITTAVAANTATWAAVSLHAKKNFPALKS